MFPVQDSNHVEEGTAFLIGQYKGLANITAILTAVLNRVQEAEGMLFDVMASQLLTRTFAAGTAQGQLQGPPDQALLQLADLIRCPVAGFTTAQLSFLIGIWLLARKSHALSEDLIGILAAAFGGGPWPSGSGGTLAFNASAPPTITLTPAVGTPLPPNLVGRPITISDSTTAANDGTFLITAATSSTISWTNGSGANDASGDIAWSVAPSFNYREYFPAAVEAVVLNVPDATLIAPISKALKIARAPGVYSVLAWGTWPTQTFFFGGYGVQGSGLKDHYSGSNPMGLLMGAVI